MPDQCKGVGKEVGKGVRSLLDRIIDTQIIAYALQVDILQVVGSGTLDYLDCLIHTAALVN